MGAGMDARPGIVDGPGPAPEARVADLLRDAAARLRRAGTDAPRLDARCLLGHATGRDPAGLAARGNDVVARDAVRRFRRLVARRLAREPTSRIVGAREFWSLTFELGDAVFDPRPDSETLVEAVLSAAPDREAPVRLLDLGTGSGCLLAALLGELPNATGVGVDVDPAALRVARRNLVRNGLRRRARLVCANWGDAVGGGFDVVVANPPYVAVRDMDGLAPEVVDHDPRRALFGGRDGLDAYREIAPDLFRLVRPTGLAALEIGRGQSGSVAALLRGAGFTAIESRRDLAGVERCLLASRRPLESQAQKGLGMAFRGR